MGCGGSKPPAGPPGGAPADYLAQATATFKLLDKDGSGSISLVAKRKMDEAFGEISVLGDEVVAKQVALGDFETKPKVTLEAWLALVTTKVEEKTWAPMAELLAAIEGAVAAGEADGAKLVEPLARDVFKKLDEGWVEPAKTGQVDVAVEAKELGDSTDEKTKGLTDGLPEGKVDADAWTTHCLARLPVLGWPRTYAMLMVYSARLEKIADMESAMG